MHNHKFFRAGGGVCETRALRWTFHQKHNQGLSFQNQETFLSLVGRLCVRLSLHQYPWICLNIHENGWINCSNYARGSEYACSSYMFGGLLKMPPVPNKPGFWMWQGSECKDYAEFRLWLIMAPYASITPGYASGCLNVPQYVWTWLNMSLNVWISLNIPE